MCSVTTRLASSIRSMVCRQYRFASTDIRPSAEMSMSALWAIVGLIRRNERRSTFAPDDRSIRRDLRVSASAVCPRPSLRRRHSGGDGWSPTFHLLDSRYQQMNIRPPERLISRTIDLARPVAGGGRPPGARWLCCGAVVEARALSQVPVPQRLHLRRGHKDAKWQRAGTPFARPKEARRKRMKRIANKSAWEEGQCRKPSRRGRAAAGGTSWG